MYPVPGTKVILSTSASLRRKRFDTIWLTMLDGGAIAEHRSPRLRTRTDFYHRTGYGRRTRIWVDIAIIIVPCQDPASLARKRAAGRALLESEFSTFGMVFTMSQYWEGSPGSSSYTTTSASAC